MYFETYGIGSSAWILSSADGSSWIEGGGIVPGPITDLNSYRCELGALLGIGIGTACLKALLPPTPHFMLTACDNLEALQKITVDRAKDMDKIGREQLEEIKSVEEKSKDDMIQYRCTQLALFCCRGYFREGLSSSDDGK